MADLASPAVSTADLPLADGEPTAPAGSIGARPLLPAWRRALAWAEPLAVAGAAPLLLFPRGQLPWLALGLVAVGWLVRGLADGVWLRRTPLDRPVAAVGLTAVLSLYPSADLARSLPFFSAIVCGVAVYYAVARHPTRRLFWPGVALLVVALVGIAALALLGTQWGAGKLPFLKPLYAQLPASSQALLAALGRKAGFNPNMVGMALAFLVPLPLALLVGRRVPLLARLAALPVLALGLGLLVLSASRGAMAATAVVVLAIFLWRWRRLGLAALALAIAAGAVAFALQSSALMEDFLVVDTADPALGVSSLVSRLEIWERARYMIADFPFTGIGLNTFPLVLGAFYPLFSSAPSAEVPHAHNLYLQTAVDFGLGGLLGFLGLWLGAAGAGWRAYRRLGTQGAAGRRMQTAVVGLLACLAAYLLTGLVDCTQLGTKQTVLLWLMLGLVVVAERLSLPAPVVASAAVTTDPTAAGQRPEGPAGRRQGLYHRPRFALAALWQMYWIVAFFLVALGYLVVGLEVAGWMP